MTTENDKRLRREIANSNERRRMQSINAGFQSLRRLLPHNDGEKLSKAAILQHAAELIQQIEQQNLQYKRVITSIKNGTPPSIALEGLEEIVYQPSKKFKSSHQTSTDVTSAAHHAASNVANNIVVGAAPNASAVVIHTTTVTQHQHPQHQPLQQTTDHSTTTAASGSNIKPEQTDEGLNSPKDDKPSGLAAIALPIEVPFTSEATVQQHQNLDTIFEAIKHLEGEKFGNALTA